MDVELYQHSNGCLVYKLLSGRLKAMVGKGEHPQTLIAAYRTVESGDNYFMDAVEFNKQFRRIHSSHDVKGK